MLICAQPALAGDDYREARAALVTAYQAGDYEEMRAAAERALDARPGYPGALFNLALAEVLDGDLDAALATHDRLLAMRIDFGVAGLDEFAPLTAHAGWPARASAAAALKLPLGDATIVAGYPQGDFIPEGIAVADNGDVFLGSIRYGSIVRLGDRGSRVLTSAAEGPHWSVFGMRFAGDRLWFVSSGVPELAAPRGKAAGGNGLFAVDPDSGAVATIALLPANDRRQVLGDLLFVDDDSVLLSDQADGVVYRYRLSTGRFSTFVPSGVLESPQGIAAARDERFAYIADYVGGLYRVRLADGAVEPVTAPEEITLYGIDGLYRYRDRLVAVQNGIRPNRVVELEFSADGSAVVAGRILAMNLPQFDEPNLGAVAGDRFYFIANSHWNRFDADGALPPDLAGPVVLGIDLARRDD